ncbi:MAG: cadherin-like beta sandwich domain-containing protein [Verrucomicrobiales bacterium]|nr:cadherin-like beta sandwich domain-containing protein [Verrucomicrobiales bacterium]
MILTDRGVSVYRDHRPSLTHPPTHQMQITYLFQLIAVLLATLFIDNQAAAQTASNADLISLTTSLGSVTPGFTSSQRAYFFNANRYAPSISVVATTTDPGATLRIRAYPQGGNPTAYVPLISGNPSPGFALVPGTRFQAGYTQFDIEVTAADRNTIQLYTISVANSEPGNADLTHFTLSAGAYTPAFNTNTTSYSLSLPFNISSTTVTAGFADPGQSAAVRVNGGGFTLLANNSPSSPQTLPVGTNLLELLVLSPNNTTYKTNAITVVRAPASTNSTLGSFALTGTDLSPAFSPVRTTYTSSIPESTTSVAVSATPADPNGTLSLSLNGGAFSPFTSPSVPRTLPLAPGRNTIAVRVAAQDGVSTTDYVITLTREQNSGAELTNLSLQAGKLSFSSAALTPNFEPSTLYYEAIYTGGVARVAIATTTTDPTASVTIQWNGGTAFTNPPNGVLGPAAFSNVGTNKISIKVLGPDGTTSKTYAINFRHLLMPPPLALNPNIPTSLSLLGSNPMYVESNTPFVDPGASIGYPVVEVGVIGHAATPTINEIVILRSNGSARMVDPSNPDSALTASLMPRNLTNLVDIDSGDGFALALRADGNVICWPATQATLGAGSYVPPSATNIVAIATGSGIHYALRSDGNLIAWTQSSLLSTSAFASYSITDISAGTHLVALLADRTLLEYNVRDNRPITSPSPLAATNIIAALTRAGNVVALQANGKVLGWGATIGQIPGDLGQATRISISDKWAAVVRQDGGILDWQFSGGSRGFTPPSPSVPVGLVDTDYGLWVVYSDGSLKDVYHSILFSGSNKSAVPYTDKIYSSETSAIDYAKPGSYSIQYAASDYLGQPVSVTRTVIVRDTTPPNLILNGQNPTYQFVGEAFVDPGAEAVDSYDGPISATSISTTGAVNTSVAGTYLVTYAAADAAGNRVQAVRTVIVGAPKSVFGQVTALGATNATLGLSFGPDSAGSAWLEWGTTRAFGGVTVPHPFQGSSPSVSFALTNLSANTLYFWRVVATNEVGKFIGPNQTFFTGNQLMSFMTSASVSPNAVVTVGTSANFLPSVTNYSVTRLVPEGWAIQSVNFGGRISSDGRSVTWGPFDDGISRSLNVTVIAPNRSDLVALFSGSGSLNNGTQTLSISGPTAVPVLPHSPGPVFLGGELMIFGSETNDVISLGADFSVMINGVAQATSGSFVEATRLAVFGQGGDDAIQLNDAVMLPSEIYGGDGNDSLKGGGGADLLFGENGNDFLLASPGLDSFSGGNGQDGVVFNGTDGDDAISIRWYLIKDGQDPAVVLHPPFPSHRDGLRVLINDQVHEMDYTPQDDFETIVVHGGTGNDHIEMLDDGAAQHWNAEFHGGEGDDVLIGARNLSDKHRGNDRLYGDDGRDTLTGNSGDDILDGGPGEDILNSGIGRNSIVTDGLDHLVINTQDVVTLVGEVAGAQSATIDWGDGIEGRGALDLDGSIVTGRHFYSFLESGSTQISIGVMTKTGEITRLVPVDVKAGPLNQVPGPLTLAKESADDWRASFPGIPGFTYVIEASVDLTDGSWFPVGQATCDLDGFVRFDLVSGSELQTMFLRAIALVDREGTVVLRLPANLSLPFEVVSLDDAPGEMGFADSQWGESRVTSTLEPSSPRDVASTRLVRVSTTVSEMIKKSVEDPFCQLPGVGR